MSDCIFCKIVDGSIPSKKVYEDEKILAFYDFLTTGSRSCACNSKGTHLLCRRS